MISISPSPFGSPTVGQNSDWLSLFTNPELWPTARTKITAIHTYYDTLQTVAQGGRADSPHRLQDLIDANAFAAMNAMGLSWSFELWPLVLTPYRDGHTMLPDQIQVALQALDNVAAQGGTVKYIRIEHGLDYGLTGGGTSFPERYTVAQMAADVITLINGIRSRYPNVQFGDQEPLQRNVSWYPVDFWVPSLWDTWLTALETANGGVQPLVFLDADTFSHGWSASQTFAQDMAAAKIICESHGVIFGAEVGAENEAYSNDQGFYDGTIEIVNAYRAAFGEPRRWHFGSWQQTNPQSGANVQGVPLNVPETAAASMTRLVNDVVPTIAQSFTLKTPSQITLRVA